MHSQRGCIIRRHTLSAASDKPLVMTEPDAGLYRGGSVKPPAREQLQVFLMTLVLLGMHGQGPHDT